MDDGQQSLGQLWQVAFGIGEMAFALDQQVDGQRSEPVVMQHFGSMPMRGLLFGAAGGDKKCDTARFVWQQKVAVKCAMRYGERERVGVEHHAGARWTGIRWAPKGLPKAPKRPANTVPQPGQQPFAASS